MDHARLLLSTHQIQTFDKRKLVTVRLFATNQPTMKDCQNFVKRLKCICFIVQNELILVVEKFKKLYSHCIIRNYSTLISNPGIVIKSSFVKFHYATYQRPNFFTALTLVECVQQKSDLRSNLSKLPQSLETYV